MKRSDSSSAVTIPVISLIVPQCGRTRFKRAVHPSLDGMPELGWALCPWAHGKGYATEALRAAVAWGDAHFEALRTVCVIHRDNHRSLRVAEKFGYNVVLRSPTDGEPEAILARRAVRG